MKCVDREGPNVQMQCSRDGLTVQMQATGSHGQPRLALPRKAIVDVDLSYRRGYLIGLVDIHFQIPPACWFRSIDPRSHWPMIALATALVFHVALDRQ